MKTKCFSVRLSSLTSISDKAYKAVAFDGSEAIIPKSQVFGQDNEVCKSEAYWISAWILEKKGLQYSTKKSAVFNLKNKKLTRTHDIEVVFYRAPIIKSIDSNIIEQLKK